MSVGSLLEKPVANQGFIAYYPEEYLVTECEEEVSFHQDHLASFVMLFLVLKNLAKQNNWSFRPEYKLKHQHIENSQTIVNPDVMLIKVPEGTQTSKTMWDGEWSPPTLIIEIASESTWPTDVGEDIHTKVAVYERVGTREYFCFNPTDNYFWDDSVGGKVVGWRYKYNQITKISPNEQGWLWSEQLNCYLVPNEVELELVDINGRKLMTEQEMATALTQLEARQARADARAVRRQAQKEAKETAHQTEADAKEVRRQARAKAKKEAERLRQVELKLQQAEAHAKKAQTEAKEAREKIEALLKEADKNREIEAKLEQAEAENERLRTLLNPPDTKPNQ